MKQLSPQKLIEKTENLIEVTHTNEQWGVAQIVCVGSENWEVRLPSCFTSMAMLFQNDLYALPKDLILHSQGNEHAKGAHYIFENTILNLKGHTQFSWSSYRRTSFLFDQTVLYYLKEKQKDSGNYGDNDFFFCQTKLTTMRTKETRIDFTKLLGAPNSKILSQKLITTNGQGFLEIIYVTTQNNNRKTQKISISRL